MLVIDSIFGDGLDSLNPLSPHRYEPFQIGFPDPIPFEIFRSERQEDCMMRVGADGTRSVPATVAGTFEVPSAEPPATIDPEDDAQGRCTISQFDTKGRCDRSHVYKHRIALD